MLGTFFAAKKIKFSTTVQLFVGMLSTLVCKRIYENTSLDNSHTKIKTLQLTLRTTPDRTFPFFNIVDPIPYNYFIPKGLRRDTCIV